MENCFVADPAGRLLFMPNYIKIITEFNAIKFFILKIEPYPELYSEMERFVKIVNNF